MIIIFSNNGTPWYLTILIFAISLISQGLNITYFPYSFLGGPSVWDVWGGSYRHDYSASLAKEEPGSGVARTACLVLAVTLSLCICRFLFKIQKQIQRIGLQGTLQLLGATPLREWPSRWFFPIANEDGVAAPARSNNQRDQKRESYEERLERVSKMVHQLPTEDFMSRQDLEGLPLHQLKVKLKSLGLFLKRGEAIDREEAIKQALDIGGSSSVSCGICCEDYVSKDSLRKLPACGHKFHLECVDRWLLSSTDYSRRQASCPMCNQDIRN